MLHIPPVAPYRGHFERSLLFRILSGKRCPWNAAVEVLLWPEFPYDGGDQHFAAAAMIDDVMIASAVIVAAVWNFSLSSSAPDRWSITNPAGHYRRMTLGQDRLVPPNRSRIPGVL